MVERGEVPQEEIEEHVYLDDSTGITQVFRPSCYLYGVYIICE